MENKIIDLIKSKSKSLHAKVINYRRHIHQFPELSYHEDKTMLFVAEQLTKIGIQPKINVGGTGVTALILGHKHKPNQNCVALRADLDALPIQEENEVDYKSEVNGVMHACGHDVHTSILLGVSEILFELKDHLPQPVKLIFQPGEEKNPGGATLMIKDGVLKKPKVDQIFGLHVFPDLEVGKVGFREGVYMASCDEIYITFEGNGGHGAMPQKAIDTILMGSQFVTSIQHLVSRLTDPILPIVLSFGHFEAIGATNVIPKKAILKGTLRTFDEKWRKEAEVIIKKHAIAISEQYGGKVEVVFDKGYPFLNNNPAITKELKEKAIQVLGIDKVVELPLRMTSEDFAFYSQEVPATFFRLGVRNEAKGIVHGVHTPLFDIDEDALVVGMQIMASSVF